MKRSALLSFLCICLTAACGEKSAGNPAQRTHTSGSTDGSNSPYKEIDTLYHQHDLPGAIAKALDLRAERGPEPELVQRLAELYLAQNEPARAVKCLREGIEKHPDATTLYGPLAQIYLSIGQQQLAREAFEKARALGAPDSEIALSFGSCLGQLGDFDGAEHEFARALEAGADSKTIHYNQALVFEERKQYPQARDLLEEILAKEPKWAVGQRELARVLLAMFPSDPAAVNRAMGLVWDAKEELKEDWRLYETMGDGFLIQGDADAAVTAYTEALRFGHNPKVVENKYLVAKQQQKQQAVKDAEKNRAVTTAPKSGDVRDP